MAANVELHIKISTDIWIHPLTIPKDEIVEYCTKPYKYLRFLGAIIFGRRQTSGSLSDSIGGDPFDDDVYARDTLQHNKVYFTSDADTHFLIDVDGAKTRRSTPGPSSIFTRNQGNVRTVRARDGERCIMSNLRYEVCHLIAHSKGNDYIKHVTEGTSTEIEEIDDARNMLCLQYGAHAMLGLSILAFLQTPNIGITREDIPFSEHPTRRPPSEDDPTHLTIHYFPEAKTDGFLLAEICEHNANVWQPLDKDNWPPIEVFNFVYALAAVKYWGVDSFIPFARAATKGLYGEDPEERRQRNLREKEANTEKKNQERQAQLLARALKQFANDGGPTDDIGDYSRDNSEYGMADALFDFQVLNRRLARKPIDAYKDEVIERCPSDNYKDEVVEGCPVGTYKDEFIRKWVRSCSDPRQTI